MKANPSHFQPSFWHGVVGSLVFTWEMYSYSLVVIYSRNLLWPHFILGCPKLWTFWRVDQLLNSHGKVASLLLTLYGVCTPNVNWSWAVSWLQLCWRSIPECYYLMYIYSNRHYRSSGKTRISKLKHSFVINRFWGFKSLWGILLGWQSTVHCRIWCR